MSLLAATPRKQFVPKYVELARTLMREISEGPLAVGDRLGTEHEIGQRFGLSRVTVRQALELLKNEGYVTRRRARGTFIARAVEPTRHFGLSGGLILLVCSNEQRTSSDEDSAFCTVLRAIQQGFAHRHFAVQILGVGQSPSEDRKRLAAMFEQDGLQAVLSIGPCMDSYADLVSDVSVVTTCSFYPSVFPWVGDDVTAASYQSTRHLLENGHRRIAMICGSWIDGTAFSSFAAGFHRAMREFGAEADRSLMVHAYPGESLEDLAVATLSRKDAPTGVFCENSRVCQAVLKAASRLGMRIPADLSLVGYGQNAREINDPASLTAYVPETATVGERAVDLLCDLISGRVLTPEHIVVPGQLIPGSSVANLHG